MGLNLPFIQDQLKTTFQGKDAQKIIRDFIFTKGNAKLGDSLVNFIYSLAKSGITESSTGTKVSDQILALAFRSSQWTKGDYLKLKGNKGQLADQVEALILFFWIQELISIDDYVKCLMQNLNPKKLQHPREEKETAIQGFIGVLNLCNSTWINLM